MREAVPEGLPVVFGAVGDKDVRPMLSAISSVATAVVVTQPPGERALPAVDLAALAEELGIDAACRPDPIEAVDCAFGNALGTVCVAGSIFLVGDVLARRARRR